MVHRRLCGPWPGWSVRDRGHAGLSRGWSRRPRFEAEGLRSGAPPPEDSTGSGHTLSSELQAWASPCSVTSSVLGLLPEPQFSPVLNWEHDSANCMGLL